MQLEKDAVTGEQTEPFEGFAIMIDWDPAGARVRINGQDQGPTPVTMGVECPPGATLDIRFSLHGYEQARHTSRCVQMA